MTLPPNKINFSGSSPTVSSLHSGASSSDYAVSNGAYDEYNNLLFYVKGYSVYNRNGTDVDYLEDYVVQPYAECYGLIESEVSIVPVPNTCNKFYIFYLMQSACGLSPLTGHALLYSVIEVNGTNVNFISNGNHLNTYSGGYNGGIAGSKVLGSTRNLYVVAGGKLDRYLVSSSGVSFSSTQSDSAPGVNYETLELEIAPDNSKIAWGDTEYKKVYIGDINEYGNVHNLQAITISTPATSGRINGVEFNANTSKLYGCFNGYTYSGGQGTQYGGIFYLNIASGASTFVNANGANSKTQIELAKDGNMYFAANSGTLMTLNPANNTISTFSPSVTLNSNGIEGGSGDLYKLPDQVDGEDYYYFYGRPKVSGTFKINGQVPDPTSKTDVYTCSPIALNNHYQNATGYRVLIQSATSTGATTSDYNYYYPSSSSYTTSLPTDLRTLNGGYLENDNNAGKYYKITVTSRDNCNKTIIMNGLIQLNAITAASASFTFNPGNGVQETPSTDYTSPNNLGYFGLGINASGSTGYLEKYKIRIENYDPATGNITSTVCETPEIALNNDPGNLSTINLNSLIGTYCQTYGYFAMNPNQYCKLTLTVSNACGNSTKTGYFTNSISTMRLAAEGYESERFNEVSVVPNPFNTRSVIQFSMNESRPVTLTLMDSNGKEVIKLLNNEYLSAGNHHYTINGMELNKGIYFYQLITDKVFTGKIVKAQ